MHKMSNQRVTAAAMILGQTSMRAVNAIWPHRCYSCGIETASAGLCPDCFSGLTPITGSICQRCGLPFELPMAEETLCEACLATPPPFARARAAFHYDDQSKTLILGLKHNDRLDLAPMLAQHLARAARDLIMPDTLIAPVPLHHRRLRTRRFNQAMMLARPFSLLVKRPVRADLLTRSRATPSQGSLNRAERFDNVRQAFQVRNPKRVHHRPILLLDDVYTTGATAQACTQALLQAGARSVDIVTVARVVLPAPIVI